MQPAESNRGQHPVSCHLVDSAGRVFILLSIHRGALRSPVKMDIINSKTSTQSAESNTEVTLGDNPGWIQQVAYPCNLLDSG